MQGTYIFAPSGELLARRNSNDPDAIAEIIKQALAKWEDLPVERRSLAEESAVRPKVRWEGSYPKGGLILLRIVRDLPMNADPTSTPDHRFNRDPVWFTKDEASLWLPNPLEVGARHELPSVIVDRLSRFAFVDNARGQTIPYHPSEVEGSTLVSEITSVRGDRVELRITGTTLAVAKGPWLLGDNYWKPHTELPHSMSTKIYGNATFDKKRGEFTDFELLALGERHGRTVMCGRTPDERSGPIGFVMQIAPPELRVAPTFINVYNADWVKRP